MTHTQRYELIDPRLVQANSWNTNVVSHENEQKLRASIERNGMFKPILVREILVGASDHEDSGPFIYQSLGGWHRVEQAIELGMTQVPAIILSGISDQQAKEISLADNARYGIDDTLKLSELLAELDSTAIEDIMPWSHADIVALTASLAVDVENLDLDEPIIPDDTEEEESPAPSKPVKTHQVVRFRLSVADAARISDRIKQVQLAQGFNTEDDLTNAGDALAWLLGSTANADGDDDAAA